MTLAAPPRLTWHRSEAAMDELAVSYSTFVRGCRQRRFHAHNEHEGEPFGLWLIAEPVLRAIARARVRGIEVPPPAQLRLCPCRRGEQPPSLGAGAARSRYLTS